MMYSSEAQTPPTSPPTSKLINSSDSPSKPIGCSDTSKPASPQASSSELVDSPLNKLSEECKQPRRKQTRLDFTLPSDESCHPTHPKKSKTLLTTVSVDLQVLNNAYPKLIIRCHIRDLQNLKTSIPSACCSLPGLVGRHLLHMPSTNTCAFKKLKLCI